VPCPDDRDVQFVIPVFDEDCQPVGARPRWLADDDSPMCGDPWLELLRERHATEHTSGPIRCRFIPLVTGAGRARGLGAARSCCHRAAIQQEGPTAVSGDRALTCNYLVAGAGFEPATSGL
jgi:hypothetical protein